LAYSLLEDDKRYGKKSCIQRKPGCGFNWLLSADQHALIENEPGVLIVSRPETMHERGYRSIRIPQTVYERVLRRTESNVRKAKIRCNF
jgi:hypothetical protein